jgi:hypothetical protein
MCLWPCSIPVCVIVSWKSWFRNKTKKKYHTAGIVPKSNRYMVKLIPLTHTFPGLAQPLQQNVSGGIKLLSWEQMFNLREMRRSNLSKIPTLTYIRKNSIIIKNAVILNIIFNIFIFVIQKLSHVYYEVYWYRSCHMYNMKCIDTEVVTCIIWGVLIQKLSHV